MMLELLILLAVLFSTFCVCWAQPVSDAENSDSDEEHMVNHKFVVKKEEFKTGKKAGQTRWLVSLEVPPYTFSRNKDCRGSQGLVTFTCNFCTRLGVKNVYAKGFKTTIDGVPTFKLNKLPDHHSCTPSPTEHLLRQFNKRLYEEPTKSVMKIYDSVKLEFIGKLSLESKTSFLQEVSSFRNLQAGLYKYRREFIPREPTSYDDFRAESDWFFIAPDMTESLVKCDIFNTNGGRIVTFATKESLDILARSDTISRDGTFKTAHKLWSQLFILSCEVKPDIWVPCVFSYLPDKTYETYKLFFSSLKKCLADNNLSLSSRWFMADFELGIRKAVAEQLPDVHIKGCHFHYSKALWSKVVDWGMKTAYSKPENENLMMYSCAHTHYYDSSARAYAPSRLPIIMYIRLLP